MQITTLAGGYGLEGYSGWIEWVVVTETLSITYP